MMHPMLLGISQRFNLRSLVAATLLFGAVVNLAGSVESRTRNGLTGDEARDLALHAYKKATRAEAAGHACGDPVERERDWLVGCENPNAVNAKPMLATISKKTRKVSIVARQ